MNIEGKRGKCEGCQFFKRNPEREGVGDCLIVRNQDYRFNPENRTYEGKPNIRKINMEKLTSGSLYYSPTLLGMLRQFLSGKDLYQTNESYKCLIRELNVFQRINRWAYRQKKVV